MGADIPSVADLKQAVESGERITPQDVSAISHAESELTGRGPIRGGPAGRLMHGVLSESLVTNVLMHSSHGPEPGDAPNEF